MAFNFQSARPLTSWFTLRFKKPKINRAEKIVINQKVSFALSLHVEKIILKDYWLPGELPPDNLPDQENASLVSYTIIPYIDNENYPPPTGIIERLAKILPSLTVDLPELDTTYEPVGHLFQPYNTDLKYIPRVNETGTHYVVFNVSLTTPGWIYVVLVRTGTYVPIVETLGSNTTTAGASTGSGSLFGKTDESTQVSAFEPVTNTTTNTCLLYTSPSPRDGLLSRMPSSA
eukprot:TRINITY_DN11936_c0_g2_i1.p1 TRINITY_DN11936_c0_g2~~TRINITY_DN11936_c0_g2_i1.p1  ORF type:complete len:231 (-),score=50.04 TRINITY_DN11936_c0_g2_i1:11-703(-)